MLDDLAVELGVGEDLRVGPEPNDGAGVIGLADDLDAAFGHPTRELLVVNLSVPVHPDLQALPQEVDRRHADSMQARRNLAAAPAELAPGVEPRTPHLQPANAFLPLDLPRAPPASVV